MPLEWVAVGGPEPDGERQLAGVQDRPHRGLPAASKVCALICAAPGARGTDEAVRPAHFDQPAAQASSWEHVPRRLSGTCHVVAPSAIEFPRPNLNLNIGGKLSQRSHDKRFEGKTRRPRPHSRRPHRSTGASRA